MEFIPAKWFHSGRLKAIRLIVIHCTVSGESGTGAEAAARYFARGERRASAHRTSDNNSTVMSVRDEDTAFAAAGANADGIHLELVGMPDQTRTQWLDVFSTAMLIEAGLTVREWSREYEVPLRWLTVAEVRDGRTKGLCTHADVSLAFPDVSTGHYDPGPHFPKDEALRIWAPESPEEFLMALTDKEQHEVLERLRNAPQMELIRKKGTTGLTSVSLQCGNTRVPLKSQAAVDQFKYALAQPRARVLSPEMFDSLAVLD